MPNLRRCYTNTIHRLIFNLGVEVWPVCLPPRGVIWTLLASVLGAENIGSLWGTNLFSGPRRLRK